MEVCHVHPFGGGGVSGVEADLGCHACFEGLLPALDAEAPAVAGYQTWEVVLGARGDEIIAHAPGEFEELVCHFDTDGVQPFVIGPRAAVAIAVKAGHGLAAAAAEFLAEDVGRHDEEGREI